MRNATLPVSRETRRRDRNRRKRMPWGREAYIARAIRDAHLIGRQTPQQRPTQIEVDAVAALPILDAQR